jgi:hypothetical protein
MHCFGSGYAWTRIDFGGLDPDPDPGGQKLPIKIEISEEVLDVLF